VVDCLPCLALQGPRCYPQPSKARQAKPRQKKMEFLSWSPMSPSPFLSVSPGSSTWLTGEAHPVLQKEVLSHSRTGRKGHLRLLSTGGGPGVQRGRRQRADTRVKSVQRTQLSSQCPHI